MELKDKIGEKILVASPHLQDKAEWVTVRGVEAGGIWIESQELTNNALQKLGKPSAHSTLLLFLPYHSITMAFTVAPGMSLDEKAFGL